MRDKAEILAEYKGILRMLTNTTALETEIAAACEERDVCERLVQECVTDNARKAQDQQLYRHRYESLNARYEAAEARVAELEANVAERAAKRERMAGFLDTLRRQDGMLAAFDEDMWYALVDHVAVESAGRLKYIFKSGIEKIVQY